MQSILIAAGLPCYLWAEAVRHSVWLGTWLPTHALPDGLTPLEHAGFPKPNLKGIPEWGVSVWVKRLGAGKLDPHADEGHFVGYDEEAEGYWVYWALKQRVSIEWDIYVDKGTTLSPGVLFLRGSGMYQLVLFQNQLSSQTILNRLQMTQKNQATKSMTYLRSPPLSPSLILVKTP